MLRYALLALLCFASSLLGSVVTLAVHRDTPPVAADEKNDGVLVAKELRLTDSYGIVRVRIQGEATAQGPDDGLLAFYDLNGIPRLRAGLTKSDGPFLTLQNTDLPNPDHKRVTLAVSNDTARIDVGHGELSEIVLQSGPPAPAPSCAVTVLGQNGSEASLYTDTYGHATIEVKDLTTASIFRVPGWKPLLPR